MAYEAKNNSSIEAIKYPRLKKVAKILGISIETLAAAFVGGTFAFYTGLFLAASAPLPYLLTVVGIALAGTYLTYDGIERLRRA